MSGKLKLLDCPFCGENDIKLFLNHYGYDRSSCSVSCKNCGCLIVRERDMCKDDDLMRETINAWNSRA